MREVLIVDDEPALRIWNQRVLHTEGYECGTAGGAEEARGELAENDYALVLLDVNMPDGSGIELLSEIRAEHPLCAVVMITAEDSLALAINAIELGAYGYLIKPVLPGELVITVVNALHRRRSELEHRRTLERLRLDADQRATHLQDALRQLNLVEEEVIASHEETIHRLARLVEFRDEATGEHLHRMSSYCRLLAARLGFDEGQTEAIRLASQLHDIGKVAVPDEILLKPGPLDEREWEVMKSHAAAGSEMLSGSSSELLRTGARIARSHHERWDGEGYPDRRETDQIPLEGRIAAVADVFDALTSDRPYRPALPARSALEIMEGERGSHFDPQVLDSFLTVLPEAEAVRTAAPR